MISPFRQPKMGRAGLGWLCSMMVWLLCASFGTGQAFAQLNQNCVVSVLNRVVPVNTDGTWVLPNIPANFGVVKARATCVNNGVTTSGESPFFTIPANGSVDIPPIVIGSSSPIPEMVSVSAAKTMLTAVGATAQLTVTASYASGNPQNVTASTSGTIYNVSNPLIATVSSEGLVKAVSTGTAVIQAVNEGRQGIVSIQVVLAGVSHGGIPDTWAIAHGLNPGDPAMPSEDPDHDGLTNLQEFIAGTDPHVADTDGDGLTDGQEALMYHTNPALFSTDGSGISDGIEVQTGTLGGTPAQKLAAALKSLQVTPTRFTLDVNAIQGLAAQQLKVTGSLIDGKTTLDLTATSTGTNYTSSDLSVCNFGVPDGNVFAGGNGVCTITAANSGFKAIATGTVTSFTPTPLSFLTIPGFANSVAVNGNTVLVAAGASGLQVVDVSDRVNPAIVGSLALSGNANDVKLLGNLAYIASGSAGLQIVDVSNRVSPVLRGSLSTSGTALTSVVRGTTAYIASGSAFIVADVSNPAAPTQISTLTIPGTPMGMDVDPIRKLAAITTGGSGLYLVDISHPAAPVILGSVSTGDARAVAIKGNYAFVADYSNSTVSVDISNPAAPFVRSNITDPNLGGFLQDIALSGNFALGADVKFVNGIPITDITDPTALQARSILNFTQRDDNGMGIAVDGSYAYLATEHNNLNKFGSTGDSRLYIGQYLALTDNKGIAPKATITSPVTGATVVEGSTVPVTVNATDDVAVASVQFTVNGAPAFTATSSPYQFNYTVPIGASSVTFGATAADLGGNVGVAPTVTIRVIPDPLTTVTGRVIGADGKPIAGAAVSVFSTFKGTSSADGTFSIALVPTARGQISAAAQATVGGKNLNGHSAAIDPVPSGTTKVGDITIRTAAVVGYYDLSINGGSSSQVGPITTAGLKAVNIGDLNTADLTQVDILFVQNPDNGGYTSTYLNNLPRIQQFVSNGGVLIFHDRYVANANSALPGSAATFFRDFSDGSNIDIVNNTTLVTNGPGGVLDNSSLDGGNYSSHGYALVNTLPAGAVPILSQSDKTHIVTFSYPYGQGSVIYGSIPLDFYLGGGGGGIYANMKVYAANVIAYGANLR